MEFDVIIVGAGPAGSVCAALCAQFGLQTLLVERVPFPRDKVCGDTVNPACAPILEQIGATSKVGKLASGFITSVEFMPIHGKSISIPANHGRFITVRRRELDQALLECAIESGAKFETTTVTSIHQGWHVETSQGPRSAKILVAADGRNSFIARSLGMQPEARLRERAAFQIHQPLHPELKNKIRMRFFSHGYAGFADAGAETMTICVVATPSELDKLKVQISTEFGVPPAEKWRSIAPISRRPALQAKSGVFLIGDAARVVEPFTGEGIYYAMRSGQLAAESARDAIRGDPNAFALYRKRHQRMYQNRLWINDLTRLCVTHPRMGSKVVNFSSNFPGLLKILTNKVLTN